MKPDHPMSTPYLQYGGRGRGDVAARLPAPARAKLMALRASAETMVDLISGQDRRRALAQQDLATERARLTHLEENYRSGFATSRETIADKYDAAGLSEMRPDWSPRPKAYAGPLVRVTPDESRLDAQRAKIAAAEAERNQREAALQHLSEKRNALGRLVQNIEDYLVRLDADVSLEMHVGAAPARGTNPLAATGEARARLAALRAERQQIETAPRTADEVKKILHRQINALASTGEPNIARLIDGDTPGFSEMVGRASFPVLGHDLRGNEIRGTGTLPDAVALVAWLAHDELLARLDGLVMAQAQDDVAIDAEGKIKRLAANRAAMLAAEREEERFLELTEAEGIEVLRREDADPRAVLGLADSAPPPVEGRP